ncbi:gluconate 2-dehydrogenase subunit 3 family protein [Thioclava sp. BHET1]|nr:gluconate 2-dehydrogenase subunit 3 family protein [Thioclava sp. BHET1]
MPIEKVRAAEVLKRAAPDLASYKPSFFQEDEFTALKAICDRLIPSGGQDEPGALDTNVPVFLDLQVGGDYGEDWYLEGPFPDSALPIDGYQLPYLPKDIYRRGLAVLDKYSQKTKGKSFADLSDADKDAMLTDLEKGKVDFQSYGEPKLTATEFFNQVWGDVKNGYMADPMYGGNKGMGSWIMIGYPGARASFREWVTQHNVHYPLGPVSVQGMRA